MKLIGINSISEKQLLDLFWEKLEKKVMFDLLFSYFDKYNIERGESVQTLYKIISKNDLIILYFKMIEL